MWLIVPLIYFLGWWQTGSFRQAFNGTIAWIIGYGIVAGGILLLDYGGYDGVSATPESPASAVAILGGFIGMWTSNIIWRRRGGDPPRKPGKWERAIRATVTGEKKKPKKKKPRPSVAPPQQAPPPPQQAPQAAQPPPVDAQYRPAPNQPQQSPQYQAAQAQPGPQQPPVTQRPPQQPAPSGKQTRNSPTADKYAKATGRALGAMFRGSSKSDSKKKPRKNPQQ